VRLSEVKGEVQIDRKTGQGFGGAMANLPVIEGDKLKTGAGVAEVEFEDNSTMRLAPNAVVEFPVLELLPSGAKRSTMKVVKGMVYVSLAGTKGNETTLLFGQQTLHLQPSSHIRLQMDEATGRLAVLDGIVQVDSPSGATEIGKKKTLTFNLAEQGQPVMAKNVASDPSDSWDKEAVDYHKRYTNLSAFGSSSSSYASNSYGVSDMLYYGSFADTGGCGSMWRPYFVSAGWDPFSNGAWAYYPNAGYSWVSPYPWGWTPYHSGSWAYCQGAGWGWQPGNTWYGLNNQPAATTGRGVITHTPRLPVRSPIAGRSTLIAVNTKPLTPSGLRSETFVFRNDSAGIGIPRGSLGKLDKFSTQAGQHGSVSAPVYSAASVEAHGNPQGNSARAAHESAAPSIRIDNGNHSASSNSPSYSGASNNNASGSINAGSLSSASTARASSGSSSGRPR
jgi:hypothetical protein